MIERLQQRRNEEGGFTLVELLVVIVILGILAAIVVFAVGGITDKGTTASNATDVSILQAAEEAAFAQDKSAQPLYLGENALVTAKYLRSASTKNDICLSNAVTGPPAIAAAIDYKVVPAPAISGAGATASHCGAGYAAAP